MQPRLICAAEQELRNQIEGSTAIRCTFLLKADRQFEACVPSVIDADLRALQRQGHDYSMRVCGLGWVADAGGRADGAKLVLIPAGRL